MIDYQNLPDNAKIDWFMQPTATNEVHTWTKPVGCNFVYMITVGGGSGGAGGWTRAAGVAGNGGAGGGSGAINTLLVPAFLIPDTLFIKVGSGSAGGPPATAQYLTAAGSPTIISAYRVQSTTEYLLFSNGGTGAASGTGASNPAGGGGGTSAITNSTLGSIGKWQGVSGNAGGNGGPAAGGSNSLTFNFYTTGGGGGAGRTNTDVAGGSILSAYSQVSSQVVVQGGAAVSGATAGQNDGGAGFWIPKRFAFYGGGGGGASNTGIGGNGGKGGPGCGGGGGGTGTTGGSGGDGGDGFALIISY